jgi:hypothetical protein
VRASRTPFQSYRRGVVADCRVSRAIRTNSARLRIRRRLVAVCHQYIPNLPATGIRTIQRCRAPHVPTRCYIFLLHRPDTTGASSTPSPRLAPRRCSSSQMGQVRPVREEELCAAVRAVIDPTDRPCRVLTNFSDDNLGCRRRVSSGIDWVFSLVEEAIFLEDDCLPDQTYFPFCEQMLDRYTCVKRTSSSSTIRPRGIRGVRAVQ